MPCRTKRSFSPGTWVAAAALNLMVGIFTVANPAEVTTTAPVAALPDLVPIPCDFGTSR